MEQFCKAVGGIVIVTFVVTYIMAAAFAPFGIVYLVLVN
tara:strand:- start:287 stop:403 length:117 start_codon:yes stop_codon:yes gene_type:complete